MFKNIGKALAVMLGASQEGNMRVMAKETKQEREFKLNPFSKLYGTIKTRTKKYKGHAKGKTTAAAQKRAKVKRNNKRKNKKGSK